MNKMKNLITLFFIITLSVSLNSCSKDDENINMLALALTPTYKGYSNSTDGTKNYSIYFDIRKYCKISSIKSVKVNNVNAIHFYEYIWRESHDADRKKLDGHLGVQTTSVVYNSGNIYSVEIEFTK